MITSDSKKLEAHLVHPALQAFGVQLMPFTQITMPQFLCQFDIE